MIRDIWLKIGVNIGVPWLWERYDKMASCYKMLLFQRQIRRRIQSSITCSDSIHLLSCTLQTPSGSFIGEMTSGSCSLNGDHCMRRKSQHLWRYGPVIDLNRSQFVGNINVLTSIHRQTILSHLLMTSLICDQGIVYHYRFSII